AANLTRAGVFSRVTAHRCESLAAAARFEDLSLDFVFLDASHAYDALRCALAAWWPKLRPGGLFAGHDYAWSSGVRAAVDAFVSAHALGSTFRTSRASWILYKSLTVDAAYCINLPRRPDRRQPAAAQFEAAGLVPPVTFVDAADGT